MASAVPIFYDTVHGFVDIAMVIVFLVAEIVAVSNCLMQRSDAFPVVGSLSKAGWLAILVGSILVTLLCGNPAYGISIFAFVAIGAALVYLLDVRPALRDATNGSGSW